MNGGAHEIVREEEDDENIEDSQDIQQDQIQNARSRTEEGKFRRKKDAVIA